MAGGDFHALGDFGELVFQLEASQRGFHVSRPVLIRHYDFVTDWYGKLSRVQVKAIQAPAMRPGAVSYECIAAHGHRKKQPYSLEHSDFIAVFIVPDDLWFILPVAEVGERIHFRFWPDKESGAWTTQFREAWHLMQQ